VRFVCKPPGAGRLSARVVLTGSRAPDAGTDHTRSTETRFKGYEDFVVQDLVLRPHVVRIRWERWLTPDGRTVLAPMPAGVVDHFGPELRRFVLLQYHQGQVTMPRLVTQLRAIGIVILARASERDGVLS
jgi:hypothetical protein